MFFPRILESLPPLPRKHSVAIGCTKNYQPIGLTVHSHCVESFKGLLQRCRRGRGCRELWKTQFFLNTLYIYSKGGLSNPQNIHFPSAIKCSDRSTEVRLLPYWPSNQPTNKQTGLPIDKRGHREVTRIFSSNTYIHEESTH